MLAATPGTGPVGDRDSWHAASRTVPVARRVRAGCAARPGAGSGRFEGRIGTSSGPGPTKAVSAADFAYALEAPIEPLQAGALCPARPHGHPGPDAGVGPGSSRHVPAGSV